MKCLIKRFVLPLVLAVMSLNAAQAVAPAGKPMLGAITLQGSGNSIVKWRAPQTATYKVYVLVPKTGNTANALYRVYPKGKQAGSVTCDSGTGILYPCYEVTVNQALYQNTWVQLMLNGDVGTQWDFDKGKGYVIAVTDNLSVAEKLNLSARIRFEQAIAPQIRQVTGAIALQGGGNSSVKWRAPQTAAYKVHVYVPNTGNTTNALYRVYPYGKQAGSTTCDSSTGSSNPYPCYEISINQTLYPNTWVQLTLNGDAATQWDFDKGYVIAVADNLSAADLLNLSALVRFENMSIAIGNTYQGGIIFYIDDTGQHGLIAAPTDQSDGIRWNNGSNSVTGATDTAVGTGITNTDKIISAQDASDYAASWCYYLVIGPYSDWFLPSKDELNLMFYNIGPGAPMPLTNIAGFARANYWSSTESDIGNAWSQYLGFGGTDGYRNKIYEFHVRAVRAF